MEKSSKQNRIRGKELFFITPIILGGNPIAPDNRVFLDRVQHIKAVQYWNKIIKDMRKEKKGE